uniref:Homing endonuclease LAGLIDADG domain-containing protein n=1 Tax=Physcomitrium patens TaxID=3218 RepID=A0A7I4FHL1_PHYPA
MTKLLLSRPHWVWAFPSPSTRNFSSGPSAAALNCSSTRAMAARGRLSFHVKQQLVWFSHLSSKDSTLGRVGQVFAATSCSGQLGLGISIIRWVNGVARGVGGQAEWQHQQQQLRFLSTREGFTGLSSAERRRNSFMCSSSGERDDNSYAGTAETFRGRGRGRGRGGGGRGRGSFRPFSDRPLKEIDNGDGQKSFYSSDGGERGNSHSSSSGRNVGNPRGRGRGRGRGRDRGGFEAAWGGRVASRPSFNGSSEEFGVDDLEKRLYFSDGGEREQFGSSSDEKYRESFRGTGRGRGRGEIGNGASKDRYHSSGGQGDRESFRGRGTRGRGGRGPSFDDRLRKGASRSPSPFYRDSNSNSGTVERWKPAQGTREEKGSYSSSRGCRGSRGRAGSFRGGRPSSQFGDNIFGEDDRIPDSRLNALKSPRLRQLFEGEEKWQRKVREKKAKTGFLQDNELGPDDDPEERGRGYQDVNEDGQDESEEENFSAVLHNSYNLLMEWYKSKDMLLEVQEIFNRMKGKKCRPNLQAYNNLIDSHILRGQLDEAEAIFEDMKKLEGFHPNLKTFCLMIEAFFRAERYEKVKDCYTYLTARKMMPPEEIMVKVAGVLGKTNVADQANGKVKRKLVSEQREILVGVLLGGAKITSHDNNRTYEVGFELTDATEAGPVLIDHLYDIFADWAQQAPRTEVNDDSRKTYRFSTVSHGSLRFYAHQYRPEGLPVIPRLIHRWLNPLSLAYWYMYGGEKCKETGGIVLNACQYTSKELTLVVKALKARTVDCVIRRRKAGNVICFKDESAVWIWKLMEPHILEGLKESLRPETPVRMNGNIVKNEPEANDGELVLKTTDEADLGIESNDTETDIDVPLKVGS